VSFLKIVAQLLREADLQIDSVVAAEFQLTEAQTGWRHSTDTASKRRVREQLNASLRSLPDWPEILDAQRLAEQAKEGQQQQQQQPGPPQQQYPQQTGYVQPQATGYPGQGQYGMQPQQTGYQQGYPGSANPYGQQQPPVQRPAFTGYPQTCVTSSWCCCVLILRG
jgi:hypothetical protein